jgi:hypothetical protein
MNPPTYVRARHWGDNDTEYILDAEVYCERVEGGDLEFDVTILNCYEVSDGLKEVYPYEKGFPYKLQRELEDAAVGSYFDGDPKTYPVVLPGDE